MNIDKRHIYGICLDTETANTITEENGKLNMESVLPYDFGFAVIDTMGRIYETYSFVISEIFYGERELMQSAYYSKKIPQYLKDIDEGKRIVVNSYELRKIFTDIIKKYNCKFIMAHNARFDYKACQNLIRWLTKSKYRYFFPYGVEFWDSLKMSRDILKNKPTYIDFCKKNGYVTKHKKPQPRFTAEVIYRYISGMNDFSESHTGLEDVKIEVEIYKYCKRQHKKMRKKLFE